MAYTNIPGVSVKLRDGGLVIPERGGSESMLIVAKSLNKNAPSEPVRIRSSNDLISQGFGDFYVGGEVNPIAAEWKAAVDGGCKVIYVTALKEIDKEYAKELEQAAIDAAGEDELDAEAKFRDVLTENTDAAKKRREFIFYYDLMMGTLLDFNIQHVVLAGPTLEDEVSTLAGAFFPEVENAENFPSIPGIVSSSHVLASDGIEFPLEITAESNDVISVKIDGSAQTIKLDAKKYDGLKKTAVDLASDIQAKINGHESSFKAKVFEENGAISIHFEEATTLESDTTAKGLGLASETFYTKSPQGIINKGSFAKTLADYCEVKTLMKQSTIGYIGVTAPADAKVSSIRKHVDRLAKLDTDVSPYLQITGFQTGVSLPGTNSVHFTNGGTHYAALVSTLAPESAPTNKQLRGVSAIRFEYSLRQLSRLSDKKIVTFRIKDAGTVVITDAITSAPSIQVAGKVMDSDFSRLSTLRITQLSMDVVREAVDPYIGEANELPQYNSINTAITSALEKIREAGAIRGYDFTITNVTAQLDHAVVLLSIIPAFELRRVDVEINLTTSNEILEAISQ